MSRIFSLHPASLLAVATFATVTPSAAAQVVETGSCTYVSCAVRLTVGFTGERLVRGEGSDEILKIDFTGGNAARFLARVESAAPSANDFRTRRTRSTVLAILSSVATGYFFTRGYSADDTAFETQLTAADYAALAGGLGLAIWGGVEAARSRNSLSRAIWEFNRAPVP